MCDPVAFQSTNKEADRCCVTQRKERTRWGTKGQSSASLSWDTKCNIGVFNAYGMEGPNCMWVKRHAGYQYQNDKCSACELIPHPERWGYICFACRKWVCNSKCAHRLDENTCGYKVCLITPQNRTCDAGSMIAIPAADS